MSRSYRNVRPKKDCVYSVEDIQRLYSVSANTVSNWIGAGLRPSDDTIPKLFRGAELIRFHKARRINASVPLRIGQFKCFGCKTRVFPLPKGLIFSKEAGRKCYIMDHCPDCNGVVHKWVNETDCDKIAQCVDTNTSLDSLDEEIRAIPVGIGNGGVPEFDVVPNRNDRLIHDWLKFAGQWDEKTVLVKLASIRMFEAFLGRKSFSYLTEGDVTAYRDDLKASVHPDADVPLSVATVRHRASHLRGFLAWLINQKACTALPRSLPDLLQLPKKFHSPDLNKRDPYVPSVVEAEELLAGMPSHTLKARRDRAMVAIAFLGALRADTVTSLRLKHLDVESRQIIQDGRQSRTKNGKSLKVCFFPVPPIFVTTVSEWKDELASLGFDAEDALFPHERDLKLQSGIDQRRPVPVLKSKGAIEKAFKIASRHSGKEITPHAAKYSIGSLMAEYCTTPAQTKAWSQNMGHESVEVTLRHYHKLSDDEVGEIFEGFEAEPDAIQSDLHTAGDKDLLLAFHEHRLPKDHPYYPRIKKLALERLAAVD